jgi:hypothetical protein
LTGGRKQSVSGPAVRSHARTPRISVRDLRIPAKRGSPNENGRVRVVRSALGVIQKRGHQVVDPSVVAVGPNEADYLIRHVTKVRKEVEAGGRSLFRSHAHTPDLLQVLLDAGTTDGHYAATAKTLQDALVRTMKTTTTAKDCVLAAVCLEDDDGSTHVSLLKLDAVVEAAQMKRLKDQGVSFKVLQHLLPEPGKLQKALSWPDPRASSDVVMLDTNFASAQYFENAFEVRVSSRSTAAEDQLLYALHESVPPADLPRAIEAAAEKSGPLDSVLIELSEEFPILEAAATRAAQADRPVGMVRRNKVAARQVTWRATGLTAHTSPTVATTVDVTQLPSGRWSFTVETEDEPKAVEPPS